MLWKYYLPLLFLVISCAPSVKVEGLDSRTRVRKENVDIYPSRENIVRPFKEIGTIVIDDDRNQGQQKLLSLAVEQACDMGADAIILQPTAKKTITYIPMDKADLSLVKNIVRYIAVEYVEEKAP